MLSSQSTVLAEGLQALLKALENTSNYAEHNPILRAEPQHKSQFRQGVEARELRLWHLMCSVANLQDAARTTICFDDSARIWAQKACQASRTSFTGCMASFVSAALTDESCLLICRSFLSYRNPQLPQSQ